MPAKDKIPYEDAARDAVGQVQGDPVPSSIPAQIATGERLPNEDVMDQMMADFRAMSEKVASMEAQLTEAQRGYAAATAALGPPPVATYGKAIFDKLVSHRNANPDLAGHFDAVIEQARPLAEAAQSALSGEGKAADVKPLAGPAADAVDKFITSSRRRANKYVDYSALEDDIELVRAAAAA